jgi:hypothetical protein
MHNFFIKLIIATRSAWHENAFIFDDFRHAIIMVCGVVNYKTVYPKI